MRVNSKISFFSAAVIVQLSDSEVRISFIDSVLLAFTIAVLISDKLQDIFFKIAEDLSTTVISSNDVCELVIEALHLTDS